MYNLAKIYLSLILFATAAAASSFAQDQSRTMATPASDAVTTDQTSGPQQKPDAPRPKIDPPAFADNPTYKPASDPDNSIQNAGPQRDENTKRIAGIIPNFQSKDDIPENRHPMTPREKYVLAFHQTVDVSAHFGNLFQAMLQQAYNGQPRYGEGWSAYASRFGAAEADQATSAFFIFGFLPHALHDDPRYWRKRYGSVWSRIKYSASRTVVTYTDDRRNTFNVPQVLGQLLQQGISTAYYPPVDRSASAVFQNWGTNLAYNSAYNVLKEFYPDFLRIAFHRHPAAQDVPPSNLDGNH